MLYVNFNKKYSKNMLQLHCIAFSNISSSINTSELLIISLKLNKLYQCYSAIPSNCRYNARIIQDFVISGL